MNKRSEEKNHETSSQSPSQSLFCREISSGEKSVNNIYIPLDLQVEILKILPVKSLMRFRCVSKEWSSIIDSRKDFIDSIVNRSLAQPQCDDTHLIFDLKSDKFPESHSFIFSSTWPRKPVSSPGPFHDYVRGLILCWDEKLSAVAIYNPTTRQSIPLPKMDSISMYLRFERCFLGYDPVENQYKVLCIWKRWKQSCQVYTLGDPTKAWRNIPCNIELPYPVFCPVCIKGTIYYRAKTEEHGSTYVLMSFDVRSETFNQVKTPKTNMGHNSTLINYQGKLGFLCCYEESVEIWVMEDDAKKKEEWSKIFFYGKKGLDKARVTGVTRCGEIVLTANKRASCNKPIKVYYYDPKRNKLRHHTYYLKHSEIYIGVVWAVPDHVENTMRL